MLHRLTRPSACAALLLLAGSLPSRGQESGLFSRFETSHGTFRARLAFEQAPLTVANFTGLAEGTVAWVDPRNGRVRRDPFYDGLLFHRVVPGFVVQAGSPGGSGADGPGYTIRDEFVPSLRHSRAGVLSMANSGPNTNGSQFFITLDSTPWLDDVHSVFGEIVEGIESVQAIGGVPANSAGTPHEDVLIHSVRIQRIGEAAAAFDPRSALLPRAANLHPHPVAVDGAFTLDFPRREHAVQTIFFSSDFRSWSALRLDLQVLGPGPAPVEVTPLTQHHSLGCFRCAEIVYPAPIYPPAALDSLVLTLATTGGQRVTYAFDAAGGGTARLDDRAPGAIVSFDYHPESSHRAALTVSSATVVPLRITVGFDAADTGRFSAVNLSTGGGLRGTFSLAASPH
ncbi:MAG TPA: peptidylprolyl isomerase [Verrucomicrobiales bacterium]|nr:peptidylprolyl isomerase [Verrucomicrobiales bacterium]